MAAATPGAPGVGDSVYPNLGNGGYDVQAYVLDLAYDDESTLVDGTMTMTALARQHLSSFNLDSAGLTIDSVEVDNRPARFAQRGEELVVTPSGSLPSGHVFAVQIRYRADPRLIAPPAGGFVATENGFALAPQPAGAHTVFPSNDHPSDKAHFVFRVTAPEGLVGVATGTKIGQITHPDGSRTTTYVSRDPIATELVQVVVGDYQVIDRGKDGGTRLRDVVPTDRVDTLEPALSLTPQQKRWIENHLGPFPLEAYGLLPVDNDAPDAFDYTGLETQTLTIYKPGYLEQPEDRIGSHMMHEIVHSWFGNSVTPRMWSDLWINEGHADFYGLLYRYERGWPDSRGYTTMEERMKYTYSQGDIWRVASGPVAKPDASNLFDNQRYTGGTLVLYALREKVGQEAFDRLERTYLDRYRNKSAGTEDFIATAVEVTGDPSVRPFLEDWLYGTTTPPMPSHPDWTVDPVPPLRTLDRSDLRTDRYEH
ncbi:MAG TPA: M1 family metallopeptidase [Actinopolymorphaceae bacterium]